MADEIQTAVREKYGDIAKAVRATADAADQRRAAAAIRSVRISIRMQKLATLPPEAVAVSLGCGNPTALLALEPGETVLDLGSGGGIDVLLSARRVGPTGNVYGLDMTDEMLALAARTSARPASTNVEFLKGDIEAIPLPDNSVDVVISNCVINLSADKDARAARGLPRAQTRRPLRRVRRRRPGRGAGRNPARAWSCGSAASPARWRKRVSRQAGERPASSDVDIEPWRVYSSTTPSVSDGERCRRRRARQPDQRAVCERVRSRPEARGEDVLRADCCA